MTEAEWLTCAAPDPMLGFLKGRTTGRKLRLLACACCRRIWHLLTDERSRRAVEAGEQYADGLIHQETLKRAWNEASRVPRPTGEGWNALEAATSAAHPGASKVVDALRDACWALGGGKSDQWQQEQAAQASLVREVFGNPFRPLSVSASFLAWAGGTLPKFARTIYEERRWEEMPVLADALEDAGCNNAEILSHCRGPGPHVRGCWALDLILGKS